MDTRPLILVVLLCGLAWATNMDMDMDYGGVPLWINRWLGEPSVLTLKGRIDTSWFRAVNPDSCPLECDCPIQWPTALYCDNRDLGQLPESLPPRTQYLFLQSNNISGFSSDAFDNVTNLRWLFLDRNQLLSENVDIMLLSNLTKLVNLFMNHNNLTDVPIGLPSGLRQLRLAYNHIEKISPVAFQNLPKLTVLLLQGNQLKMIGQGDMNGLPSLNLLDLSHNLFDTFPKHLPSSVQQLYLSNNSLVGLSESSLRGFSDLRYLRLGYNRLQNRGLAPGTFDLDTLIELDLSHNLLAQIPVVPTTLQYLYLEANHIQAFNMSSFCRTVGPMEFSQMKILRLDGNRVAYHQLPSEWMFCLRVLQRIFI